MTDNTVILDSATALAGDNRPTPPTTRTIIPDPRAQENADRRGPDDDATGSGFSQTGASLSRFGLVATERRISGLARTLFEDVAVLVEKEDGEIG